jgi:hypothetical protein
LEFEIKKGKSRIKDLLQLKINENILPHTGEYSDQYLTYWGEELSITKRIERYEKELLSMFEESDPINLEFNEPRKINNQLNEI